MEKDNPNSRSVSLSSTRNAVRGQRLRAYSTEFQYLLKNILLPVEFSGNATQIYKKLLQQLAVNVPVTQMWVIDFSMAKQAERVVFSYSRSQTLFNSVNEMVHHYLARPKLYPAQQIALIKHQLVKLAQGTEHRWLLTPLDGDTATWILVCTPEKYRSVAEFTLHLLCLRLSVCKAKQQKQLLASSYKLATKELHGIKRLERIHAFALALAQSGSLSGQPLFRVTAALIQKQYPNSWLHILKDDGERCHILFSSANIPITFNHELIAQLQKQGNPLIVPTPLLDKLHETSALEPAHSISSAMIIPISLAQQNNALVLLESHHAAEQYDVDSLALLEYVSAVIASAILKQESGVLNKKLKQIELKVYQKESSLHRINMQLEQHIIQKQELEHQLFQSVLHDPLTGLPNRLLMVDRVEQALQHQKRHGGQLALLFIDLDDFKTVNDRHGHCVGDRLLKCAATHISQSLRATDLASRWGGDEFVVLLDSVNGEEEVSIILARLRSLFSDSLVVDGELIPCHCSVGVNLFSSGRYKEAEKAVHDADLAMYKAKKEQGFSTSYFDISLVEALNKQKGLTRQLCSAMNQGEIIPHYQPMIRLIDNQLMGFEVMARWSRCGKRIRCATEFIPLAEKSGLVIDLDLLIVRQALQQLLAWQQVDASNHQIQMAMNLSGMHLDNSGSIERIIDVVKQSGVDPALLVFEFSEREVVQHNGQAIKTLAHLHAEGVKVGLDDFGTGFSSLNALFEYPVDFIKVDRSYTHRMLNTHRDMALMRAIRDISNDLGFQVIIEGIETQQQHAKLVEMGCEFGQGHFIAHPMQQEDITPMLSQSH